ncbi:hypothetical protein C8J56DRAFT_892964 [Mycena floridula]|nr:hypothetical protein C8J56DRAFT_892964 [Mycena floridula]
MDLFFVVWNTLERQFTHVSSLLVKYLNLRSRQLVAPLCGSNTRLLANKLETVPGIRALLESPGRKRGRKAWQTGPRKKRKAQYMVIEVADEESEEEDKLSESVDAGDFVHPDFLQVPLTEVVNECIQAYIDETGTNALAVAACAVCAQNVHLKDTTFLTLSTIPSLHLLSPASPVAQHRLWHGALLHRESDSNKGYVCNPCLADLKKESLPPLALANDMWIGDVPFALSCLTLPERLLIAHYLPVAYIVKLYLKTPNAKYWSKDGLQSGIRGNVSTHPLATNGIASLASEARFPANLDVLLSTIGITFVGLKGYKKSFMQPLMTVRRFRVFDALVWLKTNNPLYSNIIIDDERLNALLEQDIPDCIWKTARHLDNVEMLERERDTYVPDDAEFEGDTGNDVECQPVASGSGTGFDNDDEDLVNIGDSVEKADGFEDQSSVEDGPVVIPIYAHSVVNVGADSVKDTDLMMHALANTVDSGSEASREYTIRYGSAFINEYAQMIEPSGLRTDGGPSNPNHLLGCFPWLFPYRKGGFETARRIEVPYGKHARWALQYHDKRFRRDLHFIFQVFGVLQKRKICSSAKLQMERSSFAKHQHALLSLTPKHFVKASQEEAAGKPFSNPTMRILRQQVSAIRARVEGTNEAQQAMRAKIWGTTMVCGPPSLWMTWNPSDTQDPVAQFLCGADIDLDNFVERTGPSVSERAVNVAGDPYAAAKYFRVVVTAIIECLAGIDVTGRRGKVKIRTGIFGKAKACIGAVEAQGRGTLHLHILMWLLNAPTALQMECALKDPAFRARVVAFIAANIRAMVRDLGEKETLSLKRKMEVSNARPVPPSTPNYAYAKSQREIELVQALQVHSCSENKCIKVIRGEKKCKRGTPFAQAAADWVNDAGNWGPKRLSSMVNRFCPAIMACLMGNQDIKLIMNAFETKDVSFYVGNYAFKQQTHHNESALLAETFAFKPVIRLACCNTLNKALDMSGPEVVSLIMGWGVSVTSHINQEEITSEATLQRTQLKEPVLTVKMQSGSLALHDQAKEYSDRGVQLEDMSLLTYFLRTYHVASQHVEGLEEVGDDAADTEAEQNRRGRGQPRSERIPYLPSNLAGHHPSFRIAFDELKLGLTRSERAVISNIQYFHDASATARRNHSLQDGDLSFNEDNRFMGEYDDVDDQATQITDTDIAAARVKRKNTGEVWYGTQAMDHAYRARVFSRKVPDFNDGPSYAECATTKDMEKIREAAKRVQKIRRREPGLMSMSIPSMDPSINISPTASTASFHYSSSLEPGVFPIPPPKSVPPQIKLFPEQMAFDIVQNHVYGGTGKMVVINAITRMVCDQGLHDWMGVTATSGVAASLIDGVTLHSFAAIPIGGRRKKKKGEDTGLEQEEEGTAEPDAKIDWLNHGLPSNVAKQKQNIGPIRYLVIDEFSMMTKLTLAYVDEIVSQVLKQVAAQDSDVRGDDSLPFGGLNVILCGDPHQFPPVANRTAFGYTKIDKRTGFVGAV